MVGCQPASLEEGIGLSEPVAAAVDEAARDRDHGWSEPPPAASRSLMNENKGMVLCALAYRVR